MKIIQGKFKVSIPREQYENEALQEIDRMMETPGLIWKIWAFNDETSEAFGVYYFRDDDLAQIVFDNIDTKTWPDFTHDIEVRIWDIQEELCRKSHVPL